MAEAVSQFRKKRKDVKKMKKILGLFCTIVMLISSVPAVLAENSGEADSDILLSKNFEELTVGETYTTDAFYTDYSPANTQYAIRSDETHGNYAEILPNWATGGFYFNNRMTEGEYKISFDFNWLSSQVHSSLSLTKKMTYDEGTKNDLLYNMFHLLGTADNALSNESNTLRVNGELLSGSITPTLNNWYHYEMILSRADWTYNVTISNSEGEAKGNGTIPEGRRFDCYDMLMNTAMPNYYIDNITVEKYHPAEAKLSRVEYVNKDGSVRDSLYTSAAAVRFVFNEAMDKASLDTAVEVDGVETGDRTISSDGMIYDVAITGKLQNKDVISYSVMKSAQAVSGNKLSSIKAGEAEATDASILLDLDFEDEPIPESFNGSNFEYEFGKEESGNTYFVAKPNWTFGGYKLSREIPTNGGAYTVSFDFSIPDSTSTLGYDLVHLGDSTFKTFYNDDGSVNDSRTVYHHMALLNPENGNFNLNNVQISSEPFEAGKWYSYKLEFNRSTADYSVVISERGTSDDTVSSVFATFGDNIYRNFVTSTSSGNIVASGEGKFVTWEKGMNPDRVFDSLMFYYCQKLNIDNVKVAAEEKAPELKSIKWFVRQDLNEENDREIDEGDPTVNKIVIDLGADMNEDATAGNVAVHNMDKDTDVSFTKNISGTKIKLAPIILERDTNYRLTVSGIVSAAGIVQSEPIEYSFRTGSGVVTKLDRVERNGVVTDTIIGDINVIIKASNKYFEAYSASLITAYYDGKGALLNVQETPVTVEKESDGEISVPVSVTRPEGTAQVKFMLWQSVYNCNLLSEPLSY